MFFVLFDLVCFASVAFAVLAFAAVGFGPGDDEAFHVANEYVSIKQLVDFAVITCLVALDLLNE